MNTSKKYTVLAPGGSIEQVKAAVEEGADGVYVGARSMSGRSGYTEMDINSIREARLITRDGGVRLFAAINRSIPPGEENRWKRLLEEIAQLDPDALIIGSPCVYTLVRQLGIHIPLHASTFMGIYNPEAVKLMKEMGFRRVILNTNIFIDEIEPIIREAPNMEYEIIAFGGICLNDNHRCNLPHGIRLKSSRSDRTADSMESTFCQLRLRTTDEKGNIQNRGRILCYPVIDISGNLGLFMRLGINHFKIAGRERPASFVREAVRKLRRGIEMGLMEQEEPRERYAYLSHISKRGPGGEI